MNPSYTTRDEATARKITAPLEASSVISDTHRDFDVDAIADEVLAFDPETQSFRCVATTDMFWESAQKYAC